MLTVAAAPVAQAAEDTCAKAYETAQELRADGLLRAARDVLRMCVRTSCPAFIRGDCGKWLNDVELALPTAAFAVRMAGKDLEQVTVVCDDELLAEKLDGRTLPMDPGKHSCRFESPGAEPAGIEVLIAEGQKNRVIEVELQPAATRPPPTPLAPAAASPPSTGIPERDLSSAPAPGSKLRKRLGIAMAAASVGGLAGFVAMGLRGVRDERSLAASCAPACGDLDVGIVRYNYLLADIGLGVGVVSAMVAGYLLLGGDGVPSTDRTPSSTPAVSAVPLADGAALTLRSPF